MPDIPTNNIELYLAKIAGEGEQLPDFPTNKIERYLAKIAGVSSDVVDIPTNNVELCLAYIAGDSSVLPPFPTNVIERYLAYIAGVADVMPLFPTNIVERYLAKIAINGLGTEKTKTGAIVHITDALAKAVKALTVAIEPVQAGSGDPSPDNVRPISGWTGANVYHSGADTSDATTYAFAFPDAAGTVYGGTLDVTNGKLTVDRAMVDLGTLTWARNATYTSVMQANLTMLVNADGFVCSSYKAIDHLGIFDLYNSTQDVVVCQRDGRSDVLIKDTSLINLSNAEFKAKMAGIHLVYPLVTPIEITLTPTEVTTLRGENNIWADAGNVTVTYLADGNASDEEALGILLGGTYNRGADDPTDAEALSILLGGTT